MKRGLRFTVLLGLIAASPSPPPLPPKAPAANTIEWSSSVKIIKSDAPYSEDISTVKPNGNTSYLWRDWLTGADMPADLRSRKFNAQTFLGLGIDQTGKVTACRVLKPSSDARLDATACQGLRAKAQFAPLYEGPGRPVAQKANMAIVWDTADRKTLPLPMSGFPSPPLSLASMDQYRGWPRQSWFSTIKIDAFPDLNAGIPVDLVKSAKGTTSIDLIVDAAAGVVDCRIMGRSGSERLDQAACAASKSLPLSYTRPCEGCSPLSFPLQFVWSRKGSHIRVPLPDERLIKNIATLEAAWARQGIAKPASYDVTAKGIPRDPRDTRTVLVSRSEAENIDGSFSGRDYIDLTDKTIPNPRVTTLLSIDQGGKVIDCRVIVSSRNPAIDNRTCDLIKKRMKYRPATDVFGDPMVVKRRELFRLDAIPDRETKIDIAQ